MLSVGVWMSEVNGPKQQSFALTPLSCKLEPVTLKCGDMSWGSADRRLNSRSPCLKHGQAERTSYMGKWLVQKNQNWVPVPGTQVAGKGSAI